MGELVWVEDAGEAWLPALVRLRDDDYVVVKLDVDHQQTELELVEAASASATASTSGWTLQRRNCFWSCSTGWKTCR